MLRSRHTQCYYKYQKRHTFITSSFNAKFAINFISMFWYKEITRGQRNCTRCTAINQPISQLVNMKVVNIRWG